MKSGLKKIVDAKPLDGFAIWLRYSDGTEGRVDLSDLAGRGVCEGWLDRKEFESVEVDSSGSLVWPAGVDLCPEALYLRLTGKSPEDRFPALKNTPVDA